MSTEVEVKRALAILSVTYPNYNFSKEAVAIYISMLKDIPAPALEAGVKQHIATSKWFPTVAELREAALRLTTDSLPSASEAWGEVTEQMRRVGSWGKPEFSHELVEKAVSYSGGWKYLCASEVQGIERSNFLKTYNTLHKRAADDVRMLPEVRRMMLGEGVPAGETA